MSPTTDNFIHSLVEMSKAFEELPQVQATLAERERQANELAQQVQDREASIIKLKAELEAKNETIRATEAARDDAELRFLELDERAAKALGALGNIMANVNDATKDLTPLKPEPGSVRPQPEAKPLDEPPMQQGQSDVDPIPSTDTTPLDGNLSMVSVSVEGQSEPLPTAPVLWPGIGNSAPSIGVDNTEPASPQSTIDTLPASTSFDDVGYHNEPDRNNWLAWDDWAIRMNIRHGSAGWPRRPIIHTAD